MVANPSTRRVESDLRAPSCPRRTEAGTLGSMGRLQGTGGRWDRWSKTLPTPTWTRLRPSPAPLVAAAVAALWSAPALAQQPDWCALEGKRIRIHTTSDVTTQGVSLGCSSQSLVIRPDDGTDRRNRYVDRVVPFFQVRHVDVSRGFRKPVVRSAAIGSSIGAVVFGGFAYLTGDDGEACAQASACA